MKILVKRINRQVQVVRVGKQGKPGPTGPQGPKGDQGDPATNLVQSVNGKQGVVVLNATDVGADPTGSASQALADAKDYTDTEVSTLNSSLSTVAKTGSYDDLSNKPTIPSIAGLATETYVDNAVAPKANATDTVNLTGNQTVADVKTFSSSPVVPTATTGTQAVNKAQMDAADALKVNKGGDTMTGQLIVDNTDTRPIIVRSNPATSYLDVSFENTSPTGNQSNFIWSTKNNANISKRVAQISNTMFVRTNGDESSSMTIATMTGGSQVSTLALVGNAVRIGTGSGYIEFGPSGSRILTGTGFPNGVVTAPVGSTYIDTNATNGASSWIKKSGTGNTGWEVLEGGIARRIPNTDLLNGWTATGGANDTMRLIRSGKLVTLSMASIVGPDGSSATSNIFYALPLGFRTHLAGNYSVIGLGTISGSVVEIKKDFNSIQATPRNGVVSANISWYTNDPWPATLPGTAL